MAEVYARCTDFRDSDPELSRARLRTRTVERREGPTVEMTETGVMGFPFRARFRVRLHPPEAWEAEGRSNMGHTRNTYRLHAEAEGTRLELTMDLHLIGPYRLLTPFVRGFVERRVAREWGDYARAMEAGHRA